ncbi:MAG: Ig-like domain-containing protein [Gemmatimonadota bacterium]
MNYATFRATATLLALAALPISLAAQGVVRVTVTPSPARVVAGETLQLKAAALDKDGKPVTGVRIRFQQQDFPFQGTVDSTGLVMAGSVSTIPVVVSAIQPGSKPVIARIDVKIVPGPAASIALSAASLKLVPRQTVAATARVFSKAGDSRDDAVTWTSSAPAIASVDRSGAISATAAGSATITAAVGAVKQSLSVTVVGTPIASLSVTPSKPQARTGDVINFKVVAKDAAGKEIAGLTPSWVFSPGKGELDADGVFVGYDAGTYTVTALLGRNVAQTTVTLAARDVRRPATVVGSVIRSSLATSEVWVHPNGKVAYLGTILGGDRVYVIDVSDPSKAAIVDSVVVNARTINDIMTSEDGKVMVITREGADNRKNGIVIATLDDPLHPKVVGEFTDGVTAGVHSAYIYSQPKFGRHVYLTNDGTGALHIIDINDPAHPKQVALWQTNRSDAGRMLHDIDVRDGMVYASYWNDGLVMLDIGAGIKGGSPSNPQLVSQYKYNLDELYKPVEAVGGPGYIRGTHTAWRHGKYVFIADEVFTNKDIMALEEKQASRAYGRLQVLDVSDIAHPKSVAFYEPEMGGVHNIWVAGDTLYMGAYNAGFRAFDISGELRGDLRAQQREIANVYPSDPKGFIPNNTMTWGVVVKNGLAYINDVNTGLLIVRIEPRIPVVP